MRRYAAIPPLKQIKYTYSFPVALNRLEFFPRWHFGPLPAMTVVLSNKMATTAIFLRYNITACINLNYTTCDTIWKLLKLFEN